MKTFILLDINMNSVNKNLTPRKNIPNETTQSHPEKAALFFMSQLFKGKQGPVHARIRIMSRTQRIFSYKIHRIPTMINNQQIFKHYIT